jgi:asparagine synthase (glutamine-hydrolysing)
MCGITGIISSYNLSELDGKQVERAVAKIEKRGPDAEGIKSYGSSILGHRRLSIMDINPASDQPMEDATGRYSIVFNGEIYNHKILKADLTAKGYIFKNESDTEVLLNGYDFYGTAFLNKLNGFFAFVIYDKKDKISLVVRDRFGIKPLLFYKIGRASCRERVY